MTPISISINIISNVCSSSYFHIRALRRIHPYLDLETSKTFASASVGFRLDYANSVLTGIFLRNIHRLHSPSALNSLHWLPIRKQIAYELVTRVHRSHHNACPRYLSSSVQAYTPTRQLRSASLGFVPQIPICVNCGRVKPTQAAKDGQRN